MNNNKGNYEEIDLLDLAKYILSKWKQCVLLMLIGVMIFGGYAVYDISSNKEDYRKPLFSPAEREKVSAYLEYQNLVKSLKNDLSNEKIYQIKIELTNLIVEVQSKIFGLELNDEQLRKIENYDSKNQSIEEFVMSEKTSIPIFAILVKQIIIGLLMGCLVMFLFYCYIYVLSGTIKTRLGFKGLRLFVLGDFKDFEIILSHLKEITKNEIAYVSTLNLSIIPSNVACVGNPLMKIDGLKIISNKDIVLIEKLKESNRQDIDNLKEFLEYCGFKIIGVILL